MSLYNKYLYNQKTYNDESINYVELSTQVDCTSLVNINFIYDPIFSINVSGSSNSNVILSSLTPINEINFSGITSFDLVSLNVFSGFGNIVFSCGDTSSFSSYMTSIYSLKANFSGSSSVKAGKILQVNFIDSSSSIVESTLTIDNVINSEIVGQTSLNVGITVDNILQFHILNDEIIYPNNKEFNKFELNTSFNNVNINNSVTSNLSVIYNINSTDISSSSIFGSPPLQVFDKITSQDISGSSSVNAQLNSIYSLPMTVSGNSSLNVVLGHIFSLGQLIFNGLSTVSEPIKLGQVVFTRPRTRINATLRAPDPLRGFGERREVSFVFEVEKPLTTNDIIDKHYRLFRFYKSIGNLQSTLDYVRRSAKTELDSYDIYSDEHRSWSVGGGGGPNDDLLNLTSGDRGIVQQGATGIFSGYDGYFAIYKGPDVLEILPDLETEDV